MRLCCTSNKLYCTISLFATPSLPFPTVIWPFHVYIVPEVLNYFCGSCLCLPLALTCSTAKQMCPFFQQICLFLNTLPTIFTLNYNHLGTFSLTPKCTKSGKCSCTTLAYFYANCT